MEILVRRAVLLGDQHVGDALALRARQEGRDERVGLVELRVHPQRTAREEHRHHRNALSLQRLQLGQRLLVAGLEFQRRDIADHLGIGLLAEHDDGDVGLRTRHLAVGTQRRGAARRLDRGLEAAPDRGRAGEVGIGVAGALPRQRPAARLEADIIGMAAGDEHLLARLDRQKRIVVLEQHQRFRHRSPRDRAVFGRAEDRLLLIGPRRIEQAELHLHAQDAAHRVVDARHRDGAVLHLLQRVVEQRLPVGGHHCHVEAGIEALRAVAIVAARHLAMRVPVANDETLEAETTLEHIRQQRAVAVVLDAVPRGEARHHGHRARIDAGNVARRMRLDQRLLVNLGVALIDAVMGSAVGDEMLDRGGDLAVLHPACARRTLKPTHHRRRIEPGDVGALRIALIGATPAIVLRHRDRRTECPVEARRRAFLRGGGADLLHQRRIAHRAEAHIVREDGGAEQVRIAVHRVHAKDRRDRHMAWALLDRDLAERLRRLDPVAHRPAIIARKRGRVAAAQHRAQRIFAQFLGLHRGDVALDHLAHLFAQAHLLHQRRDEGLGLGVDQPDAVRGRPERRVRLRGGNEHRTWARPRGGRR